MSFLFAAEVNLNITQNPLSNQKMPFLPCIEFISPYNNTITIENARNDPYIKSIMSIIVIIKIIINKCLICDTANNFFKSN